MANVALEDLLAQVRPECGGCPTEQLLQAFVNTIRDFCNFTRAYQFEAPPTTILINVPDYAIQLPAGGEVEPIAIEYLSVDAFESKFKDMRYLDQYVTNWRLRTADDFRFFTHLKPGTITFPGIPTKNGTTGGVYYRVSLRPTLTALNIDQALANEWLEAWSDGTRAKILAMAGKPWSNPQRSIQLDKSYHAERGMARIRVTHSYGNAEQRWQNRGGFA